MATGIRRKGRGVEWTICVPEHLALRFETLNFDRANNRPIFGAKSQIISELLSSWVDSREAELAASSPSERIVA